MKIKTICALSIAAACLAARAQGFSGGTPPNGGMPGGGMPGGGMSSGAFKYAGVVSVTTNADWSLARDGTVYGCLSKNTALSSGAAVGGLADGAFAGRTELASVNLSASSITNLPPDCFAGCTGLKIVVLPDSCTTIGSGAFAGCTALTTVIANGLETLGDDAFRDCTALAIAPSTNGVAVGMCAFANCPSIASMIRYTLDYDSDGGTVATKSLSSTGVTTFTAKAKSGYLFAYWLDADGDKVAFTASLSLPTATLDGTYTAVFRAKSDCAAPSLDASAAFVKGGSSLWNGVRGVRVSDRLSIPDACYPVKFSAKNLPTGLSLNATSGAITGVPTKSGTFKTVFTVTSRANSAKKVSVKLPIAIAALPVWTRGKFTGTATDDAGESASAAMNVTAAGKITGSVRLSGTNWTFSASSFNAASAATGDDRAFVVRATAKATYKVKSGKKTVTKTVTRPLGFSIVADPDTSAIAAKTVDGYFGTGALSFVRDAGVSVAKAGETAGGMVSLSTALGQAASNSVVKATAKLKSGYAFTGWYDADGNLLSKALACKVTMAGSDVFLTASFAKESALERPSFDWGGETNLVIGTAFTAKPTASAAAAVKIASVSGLPAGISWKSGKATGVPTKAKAYTAVVKVALSTNAKKKWTYRIPLTVSALPAWARGTFNGGSADGDAEQGVAVMTVSSAGKISGTWRSGGTNWVMSAAKYASYDAETGCFTANVALKRTYTKKVNGKTKTYTVSRGSVPVTVGPAAWAAEYTNETWQASAGVATGALFTASRNMWTLADWKALGSELFGDGGKTIALEGDAWGLRDGECVTLLVKASGAVTATGDFQSGSFDSTGAAVMYTPTSSATLEAWGAPSSDGFAGMIHVYFPPSAKNGLTDGWLGIVEVDAASFEGGDE